MHTYPGSTLGQQLYNARIHAKLSAHEATNGMGLRRELPDEHAKGWDEAPAVNGTAEEAHAAH